MTLAPLPQHFVRVRDLIPLPRTVRVVIGRTVIVRGDWGCGWPRQTIEAWRARRGLK